MLTAFIRLILAAVSIGIAGLSAQPLSLAFKPLDVQYSRSLDRLIMVSVDPNLVHIVNPVSGAETTINLSLAPLSLSVSPDGTHAAVGHDGWISYVDLQARYVEKNLTLPVTASVELFTGNGNIWVPPGTTVNVATGIYSTSGYSAWVGIKPALHPNGDWIHYTRGGSPDDIIKGDISSGTYQYVYDSRYHGDFRVCGGIFYSADGKRLLTGCGTLFRTTASASDDLTYNGSLESAPFVTAAADSAISQKFAVLPGIGWTGPNTADSEVQFYDNQYLTLLGRVALPTYQSGLIQAPWHGRHVFYNPDATRLHVVMQVDATANLVNDYAIYSMAISSGSACAPSLASNATNMPASGGNVEVAVTATGGCLWQASSNVPWLSVGAGGVTSGSGAVTILVAPNLQTEPRTGTVTIADLTYTVTQDAASSPGVDPIRTSPVRPIAADYSAALDRMILVSSNPDLLTIFNPITGGGGTVPLVTTPTSLSISPDGLHAAVGHDGWISYVNLATATAEKTLPVTAAVYDLALGATEIYAFPLYDQWAAVRVVNISTGMETLWDSVRAGSTSGKISPNGKYLYVNASRRYDITQPLPSASKRDDTTQPLRSASEAIIVLESRQWFSQDGSRLFSGSGRAFRLSDIVSQDLQYNGTLESAGLSAVADSSVQQVTATVASGPVNDTTIKFFAQDYLANIGSIPIPDLTYAANPFTAHGRFLFWNAAGNRLFAVVQADETSGALNDYSIYTVSFNGGCHTSLDSASAEVPAAGGGFSTMVSADAGCAWKANSSASWLTISANAIAAGQATVSYIVDPNPTTSVRTATITVDGTTLTVTQAAGTAVQPSAVTNLPFRVADAEYSNVLDRIVAISGSPNRLNIYNPATGVNVPVALPLPGNAVTVQHGGLRAAVCHDGLVSIFDLRTATLEKTVNASLNCVDIVFAGNGYVYMSASGGWGTMSSINTATGVETKADLYYNGTNFRLNAAGDAVYTSASKVTRYGIANGPMQMDYGSDWYPANALGNKIWFTGDGRMAGDSGGVFRTGSTRETDFIYTGTLSGSPGFVGSLVSIAHSTTRHLFASIGPSSPTANDKDVTLYLHGDEYLTLSSKTTLPRIIVGGMSAASHGKFVFWDSSGTKAHVVMQADPSAGFLNDYAVYTLSPGFTPGCAVTLGANSGTAIAYADTGIVTVNAGSECVWEVKSNAAWIKIDTGTLGAGIGNVGYSVLTNPNKLNRTGTITIGTETYTLTQAGALLARVHRPATFKNGAWRLDSNGNGAFDAGSDRGISLGWAGATAIKGDWNGDGKTKVGVYSNGYWYLDYDGNGVWDGGVNDRLVAWGWSGATPIVGDWNGDGTTKIGVYSNGFWFLDYDGDFSWDGGVVDKQVGWGWSGVTPVVGDWDGDGRTSIGVYANGFWFLDYNGDYTWDGGVADKQVGWGWSGVTPIMGDWNGDGRTKIGVYAGGFWYLDYDGNYLWQYPGNDKVWSIGWGGATLVMGDWNGDGKTKAGAFINGYWYLDYDGSGSFDGAGTDRIYLFGQAGDTPVVGRW